MARVYGVHDGGKCHFYDTESETWNDLSPPTAYVVNAVHGTGPNNIWVGCAGFWGIPVELWHYNGSTWTKHEINLGASGYGNIVSLWVLSETEAYATASATNYQALWKWNGITWSCLYSGGNSPGLYHVQALSSTEVYMWGYRSSAYPNRPWALFRWNGSSLEYETTEFEGVSGYYVDAFTAVDSNTMYIVPRWTPGSSVGEVIYKGKFGGPWTIDYDFSGEGNGFYAGNGVGGMVSDPATGYVYGVTCNGGNVRKQRIKDGTWSTSDGPPLHVNALGCRPVSIGGAGVVRIVQADYLFGDDCGVYYDSSWHTFNRDAYRDTFISYDGAAPYLSNQSPRPDSNSNPADTPIGVEVLDDGFGVDGATVQIWVGGTLAWDGASIQSGFSGSRVAVAKGYRYDFRPDTAFAFNDVVSVRVAADDNAGNSLDTTYYFGVEIEEEYVGYGDQYGEGQFGEEYGPRPWEPNWVEKFYTDFTDSPSVVQSPGDGTITESGDGTLDMTIPSGTFQWWTTCPIAYVELPTIIAGVVRLETRLTLLNPDEGYPRAGLSLMQDRINHYHLGYERPYDRMLAGYIYEGSEASATAHGNFVPPAICRLYWNPSQYPRYVPDFDAVMQPNEVRYYYSTDEGDSFIHIRTLAGISGLVPRLAALFLEDVTMAGPNASAEFTHLLVSQWDRELEEWIPYPLSQPVDPQDTAGLEDVQSLPSASGAPRWDVPELDSDVPLTKQQVGLEDVQSGPITASGKPIWSSPDALPGDKPLYRLEAGLEDVVSYFLTDQPEISTYTTDANAIAHFLYTKPYLLFYYDTTGEAWANPTTGSFTGYARNGKHYTGGVEDPGPVWAPWATEAQSANRGPRDDFPLKALLAMTKQELVIFDLDSFDGTPASLHVWMRFTMPDTTFFRAIGRGSETIACIRMKNGTLFAGGKPTGWENGRLHSIDFKANDQSVYSLIGSDNHWWGVSGKTIVNRNDTASVWTITGVSPSLRIALEYVYDLAILDDGTDVWVAAGGEDSPTQVIRYSGNRGQEVVNATGDDIGGDDLGNIRHAVFDEDGWLWFAIDNTIYRNVHDYRERYILAQKGHERVVYADLPSTILDLVSVKNSIYARTAEGIWRILRGSMEAYLAYTVEGGGGGGRSNTPPDGELLGGSTRLMQSLQGFTLEKGSLMLGYLIAASWIGSEGYGAVTIIRLFDDAVIAAYEHPTLTEPGALYAATTLFT